MEPSNGIMCPRRGFSRRAFLGGLLKGGVLALIGSTLYPIVRYLYPPMGREASVSNVVAGRVGELAANQAKIFRFGSQPALLVHTPHGDLKAFSAVCTHLNCTVQYDDHASVIWCACHNGKFDLNGQVISGPPPRPLEAFQVNIRGDDIVVSKSS
ncbi:MAG TPA: Rieske (2Fe-2S) protein [bacterium]